VTGALPDEVAFMEGVSALPRDNGELVFAAPWQGRAFALAIALVEQLDLPWDAFRERLIDAIAQDPARPYYDSWAVALESLVVSLGLTTPDALDFATPTERAPL
jgi:nitrile hydratase accessory protein